MRRVRALEGDAPEVMGRFTFSDFLAEKGIDLTELREEDPEMRGKRAELFLDYYIHRLGHVFTDIVRVAHDEPCRVHGLRCPARGGEE
jgi:hypothetical protein